MAMDREDRLWFDGKVEGIHKRITDAKEELTEKINEVSTSLKVHKALPCQDVIEHIKEKHNLPKFIAFVASIMAIVGIAYKFVLWLIASANVRP